MNPTRTPPSLCRAIGTTALLSVCVSVATARADASGSHPWTHAASEADVGPVERARPAGFVEAKDAAELRRLIADPAGPSRIWLGPRDYEGDFLIARPLTLLGAKAARLIGSGTDTVLTLQADDVVIENIEIARSGRRSTTEDAGIKAKGKRIQVRRVGVSDALFGVAFAPCEACTLERSRVLGDADTDPLQGDGVKLWEASDSTVRECVIENSRDLVVWYSRRVTLQHNRVTKSRYGLHFMYAHDSHVLENRIEDNVVGAFIMYSARLELRGNLLAGARGAAGVGVGFKESDGVSVTDNAIVANTTGAYLDGTPRDLRQPVTLKGNLFALNDVGVRFHGSNQGLAFRENTFHENTMAAEVEGGGDALSTEFRGNRWSEYVGYDLNDDGVGDVAYEVKKLSGELTDAHPHVRFFRGTLAMALIDAIAQAVPVLASKLLLRDPAPRVSVASTLPGGAP